MLHTGEPPAPTIILYVWPLSSTNMEPFFRKCLAQWYNARKETFGASGTAVLQAIKDARYKRSKSLFLKPMAANDDPKHPFNYRTNSVVENYKKIITFA